MKTNRQITCKNEESGVPKNAIFDKAELINVYEFEGVMTTSPKPPSVFPLNKLEFGSS